MRQGGAIGSENVGMSNRNPGESPGRRKPKVSLAMTISQGLGGPKLNTERCSSDGMPVNIPAPRYFFNGVRILVGKAGYWIPVPNLRFFKD